MAEQIIVLMADWDDGTQEALGAMQAVVAEGLAIE